VKEKQVRSFPFSVNLLNSRCFDLNNVAFEFDSLARADLAAFAGFELAVDGDESLRDDCLSFTTGHDEVHGLEQFTEFDIFFFDRKGHVPASFICRRMISTFLKEARQQL
jgi:hypothetical protein